MERLEQLIEWWVDLLVPWLEPMILSAGYALLLAMIVLVINIAFRRWLTAGQMALLWGLVLVRLALPVAPSSAVSLGSCWDRATTSLEQLEAVEPAVIPATVASAPHSASIADAVDPAPVLPQPFVAPVTVVPPAAEADPLWITMLSFVAMTIVSVFPFIATAIAAWTGFAHWRLCRFLRLQTPCTDERLQQILNEARSAAGIRRAVRLYVIEEQQQPAVMGVRSPAILLPLEAADLSDARLRLLMLHELAHVRRRDVLINWLLAALKVAQWWNPVFWLAASRFGALREQACDAFAVTKSGDGSSRDYGEILLHFASTAVRRPRWLVSIPASLLGISSVRGKFTMRRRLQALRVATKRHGRVQRGVFATLAIVLAISGWTNARDVQRPNSDPWIPPVSGTWDPVLNVEDEGETITAELDVSDLLARHQGSGLSPEVSEKAVISLIEPMLRTEPQSPEASWEPKPSPRSIRIVGTSLKLTAPQAVVDEVSRLVAIWAKTGLRQISMECRIIRVEGDLASQVGVGWKSMGQLKRSEPWPRSKSPNRQTFVGASAIIEQPLPICVAALNKAQVFQFVRSAQSDRKSSVMFAPKITVFNGSAARLSTMLSQPFVVGALESETGQVQTTIKTIDEGIALSLCPTERSENSPIDLTGRLELSDISDVTLAAARLKSGKDVNVQIPRVQKVCIDVDSTIEEGESLLIGCLPSYERREFVYLLITPRVIDEIDELGRLKR